jgi:glucose dehydrogenase (acceptor)
MQIYYNFVLEGYCPSQETVKNGERCSTANAFLRPAMGRKNLHVSMNSHVTKVYAILF